MENLSILFWCVCKCFFPLWYLSVRIPYVFQRRLNVLNRIYALYLMRWKHLMTFFNDNKRSHAKMGTYLYALKRIGINHFRNSWNSIAERNLVTDFFFSVRPLKYSPWEEMTFLHCSIHFRKASRYSEACICFIHW